MDREPHLLSRAEYQAWQEDMATQYLPSLERLVKVAKGYSGQSHHARRILLAIYNANDWPLDLSRLRQLDYDLQLAALDVLRWFTLGSQELHTHLPRGDQIMKKLWAIEAPDDDMTP